MKSWSWLSNGSRLSCGANAGWRKLPALRYRLAGAQTEDSSESRPRQLQALVRRRHISVAQVCKKRNAAADDATNPVPILRRKAETT